VLRILVHAESVMFMATIVARLEGGGF